MSRQQRRPRGSLPPRLKGSLQRLTQKLKQAHAARLRPRDQEYLPSQQGQMQMPTRESSSTDQGMQPGQSQPQLPEDDQDLST